MKKVLIKNPFPDYLIETESLIDMIPREFFMKRLLFILSALTLSFSLSAENRFFLFTWELLYNYDGPERIFSMLEEEQRSSNESLSAQEQTLKEARYFFIKGIVYSRSEEKDRAEEAFLESYKQAKESLALEETLEAYRTLASAAFNLSSLKGVSGIISMADELDGYTETILKMDPEDPFGLLFGSQKLINAPRIFGGDPKEALVLLEQIEPRLDQLDKPLRFDTLEALSRCWEKLKDKDKARYYADQALRLYPRNQQLLEWREKLK